MPRIALNLNGASAEPVSEAKTAPRPISRLNSAIFAVFMGGVVVILYFYGPQILTALARLVH
jgi:hypothetical protein